MDEELKPCPICGGTNLAMSRCVCTNMDHEFMPDAVHMHVFDLYCKECGCRVQAGGDAYDEAKEAVIEKWNRRAERTCRNKADAPQSFLCGKCGWFDTDVDGLTLEYSYCPHCGARVMGE